ncbi:Superfamily II DNA and RNA helicase [Roseovarius nanhaiticus]|uniref:DEAD-box ATP-dependent RNA helicase RhpA n=1 Tax=Roseovarius nanhaiticus TaxID=573024 RepID=A0A1N7HFE3_9RHOB|nr:DEAD/DEAH box helicase [Roseovarius nanhaiticus]SEK98833.1 Superfamily II DNA and RNA helicase [Roseovarius nanhaiticus]SIS23428.1 Superfamily II DNA and RNA helicase [Roseovarius nanhaiticus]
MTKFSDLNLNPKVLKAIDEAGYTSPTPIQAGAIPPALEGRDVLGIAQTGTGKTASFTLPMLSLLARGRARARMPRSLVLCPTRELAAQVAENFDTYSKHLKLTKALLIGGVSFKEQDKLIDKGVDVLIATPGRLLDHFERGKLLLTGVQIMVVDEADRMLDMGFIPDIERIFSLTPFTRQTFFFSATMAPEIERITNTFLSNPERVEVARQATASETIEQGVVMFKATRRDREASEKRAILRMMIDGEGDKCTNAIVFCNRKIDVDAVAKSLKKHGYDAAPIHGDLDQSQRTRTLDGFRAGDLRLLVASDVAARGLDVPAVSHVFNFDVPSHPEDYVHRIGRTGRAGRDGKAMMICVPKDEKNMAAIEALIQKDIPRLPNPLGDTPEAAPAPEAEADTPPKPRRSRSRRKPSGAEDAGATAPETSGTQTQSAPEHAPEPAPKAEPEKAAPREERSEKPRDARNDDEQEGKSGRSRSRGGRGRSGGGGNGGGDKVVGMGDHMPSFIALSFEDRRAS